MAQCATTALVGAVPRPCVRGARGRFRGFGPVPGVGSLPFPPSRPACPALRVAGRPVRVSLTLALWYTIPRGLCILRARSGCPSGSPHVPVACVCARAPAASAPSPLGGVACAPRAVPALGTGRAVSRGPCPSACPAPVPCSVWCAWGGGGGPVPVPPYLAWGCGGGRRASPGGVPSTVARGVWGQAIPLPRLPAHWAGCWGPLPTCCWRGRVGVGTQHCPLGLHALWGLRAAGVAGGRPPTWLGAVRPPWGGSVAFVCRGAGWGGGGGGPCAVPPVCVAGGACRAGGRSASFLPSAFPGQATKRVSLASFRPWGAWPPIPLQFVLARLHWGAICAASWRVGAGSLVPRGSCESRRLGRGGGPRSGSSLGRGEGGPSPRPRGLRAGAPAACGPVGGGGGGVAPRPPCSPSGWRVAVPYPGPPLVVGALPPGVRVRSGSRGRPGVRGDERRPADRSLGCPFRPETPRCPPSVGSGHEGVMGGAASILFWCAAVRRAQAWSAHRSGALVWARPSAAAPAGAGGWGRWGARCAGPAASPPPPRRGPFWGRGGVPLAPGGLRVAPVALNLGGGGEQGEGVGEAAPPPSVPPPRRASACHLLSPACPPGVYSCCGGCRAAAGVGRGPVGRQWVSAAGGGGRGGEPRAPVLPGPASEGAASFAPSCAPPVRRRPAAGRACGRLPRPRCPRTPGAAASSGGGAGPPSLRSASVRSWA